jgi:tetratricopeptide (TPR) repeat protein
MTLATQATTDGQDRMRRAKAMLQDGKFAEAAALCEQLLDSDPQHQDALYTAAVAQRYQRRFGEALLLVGQLIEIAPRHARAFQERGHIFREIGDQDRALAAYQTAVGLNGALAASWKMLADLHLVAVRRDAADYAAAQHRRLAQMPQALLAVSSAIEEGRLLDAERMCRAYLQTNGHDVEAMRLLAQIGIKFNVLDEAEFLLESCTLLEPDFLPARYDYVDVLHKRQKFGRALDQAADLRSKDPGNAQVEMLYANENLSLGNFDEALGVYRTLLERTPNSPGINLTLGHALKTVGKQEEAIASYRRAYAVKPDFGDAYWSLANLKTYRFEDREIGQMLAAEEDPATGLSDRYHLCFALGKALEDHGDYGSSFDYYERGNRLKRDELSYDWRRISREIDLQIEHVNDALLDLKTGSGSAAPDPIFIVGLPRAGSTLIEQILASHSQIEGTMELPNILALAHRIDGRRRVGDEARYPANLRELGKDELTTFGDAYIRDTMIHRKLGKRYFIDKMPNNFRHIGLIHMILPNARIIDARRDGMSCCFSGFKQLFAEGQEFTYGLEEVGHYYRDYVRLMDHWDEVLPGKVLRVDYQDVVSDLEPQVRRLLDFIGLPFEPGCLDFHANERAVRTASSEQVRKPIFRSGLDQWKNYSSYLDPLRAILGPELVDMCL